MWGKILIFLLKLASSKTMEVAIGVGVNALLESKDSGIGKTLATTIINGVVTSKSNNLKADISKVALKEIMSKL